MRDFNNYSNIGLLERLSFELKKDNINYVEAAAMMQEIFNRLNVGLLSVIEDNYILNHTGLTATDLDDAINIIKQNETDGLVVCTYSLGDYKAPRKEGIIDWS